MHTSKRTHVYTHKQMCLHSHMYTHVRTGRMPVMEIVFLARKSHIEEDKLIQFESVWGLPAKGE